jgi:predicted aspartyl protease
MNRIFRLSISSMATMLAMALPTLASAKVDALIDPPAMEAGGGTPAELVESLLLQEYTVDATNRMVVPVQVNGSKPYPFIVDTGSERTVIANDLARFLKLASGTELRLATISGPATVPSFLIDNLSTSTLSLDGVEAPGLERSHLGAFGLLGIDSLEDNKLFLDFRNKKMELLPSKKKRSASKLESGMIIVTAKRRAGRLILSNALVGGIDVDIVIDTGAQSSMGNFALRDRLSRRNRGRDLIPVALSSVIGAKMTGDFTQIKEIDVGGVTIKDLPIVFSENYAATVLGLEKRPAIFLGMDALGLFDKVVIDFVNNRVSFALPKGTPGKFSPAFDSAPY